VAKLGDGDQSSERTCLTGELTLHNLALEVVDGLLVGGDLAVELVVASVVDIGDAECEARGHVNAKCKLAILAVSTC